MFSFQIMGKVNKAICYASVVDDAAIAQIKRMCDYDLTKGSKIRIMPDVHAGKGCTIGTTMTIVDKVCPNIVGVDLGCLDCETEVLTPSGWVKMPDWKGEEILVYNPETNVSKFEIPYARIENDCEGFYRIFNKYGIDMMLSEEHIVPVWKGYGQKERFPTLFTMKELAEHHNSLTKGVVGMIKTTFGLEQKGLGITNDEVRVWAMLSADGCIRHETNLKSKICKWKVPNANVVELHFKKERKIKRCKELLEKVGYAFRETLGTNGTTTITTTCPKWMTKSLKPFWKANQKELKILSEECLKWDGTVNENRNHASYSSTNKENIDIIQFAFAVNGTRCGIFFINQDGKGHQNASWQCYITKNGFVGLSPNKIEFIKTPGAKKYCAITSTGYFVIRRNGKIAVTHNCGMHAVHLGDQKLDFAKIDEACHFVPSGFDVWDEPQVDFDFSGLTCLKRLRNLDRLACSLGTLGGGNHFIEIDRASDGSHWLVVHSGSRNLGKQVAEIHQQMAIESLSGKGKFAKKTAELIETYKAAGRNKEIKDALKALKEEFEKESPEIPEDLCWLTGQSLEDYLNDVRICQAFAKESRELMAKTILKKTRLMAGACFHTIHNYIDVDEKVLRKGAIAAHAGEKVLIPVNMRDGVILAVGKGNPDWNFSAPHGAGRLMSRAKAKENFTLKQYKEAMEGVYTTSVNKETLDESPMAYKSLDDIIEVIKESVNVLDVMKSVYNFKASGD